MFHYPIINSPINYIVIIAEQFIRLLPHAWLAAIIVLFSEILGQKKSKNILKKFFQMQKLPEWILTAYAERLPMTILFNCLNNKRSISLSERKWSLKGWILTM